MLRAFLFVLTLALPATAVAQTAACPGDVHQQIYDLTETARAGETSVTEVGQAATGFVRDCGRDRSMLGQILVMFTEAGLAIEPPDADRFRAHLNAFKTINLIKRAGDGGFAPLALTAPDGTPVEWSEIDERNAYWDLMFTMAADFLVYGVHADVFTPGVTETLGCGLYPAEEASALASHAIDNVDGGELMPRVSYLGRSCDTPERETTGYVAQYFAAHARARAADTSYLGLTGGDIRSGLKTFLMRHLDGAGESMLFTAEEVTDLLAY